jgi:hypothetical protein
MSFTYDLSTNVGMVRIALGDSTEGSGVRPDGTNLSDEELTHFLTLEGNDVDRATARACEVLATQWAGYADLTVGPRSEKLSQIAARYAERAKGLRGAVMTTGYVTLGFATTDGA